MTADQLSYFAVAAPLIGVLVGAGISLLINRSNRRTENLKLLSNANSTVEIESARIQVYRDLWAILGKCSTFDPSRMIIDLPKVQAAIQEWYYDRGGGLLIAGTYEDGDSTKAALFSLRDLDTSDRSVIWKTAHNLRHCLRRDLRIFEDPQEEHNAMEEAKKRLNKLALTLA